MRDEQAQAPNGIHPSVRLNLDIEANLPLLKPDRTRIKLLLRNLLDNAQHHGQTIEVPLGG